MGCADLTKHRSVKPWYEATDLGRTEKQATPILHPDHNLELMLILKLALPLSFNVGARTAASYLCHSHGKLPLPTLRDSNVSCIPIKDLFSKSFKALRESETNGDKQNGKVDEQKE